MTATTESKTDRIRALNDAFRRTFVGGAVMITAGVEAMPLAARPNCACVSVSKLSQPADPPSPADTTKLMPCAGATWLTRPREPAIPWLPREPA